VLAETLNHAQSLNLSKRHVKADVKAKQYKTNIAHDISGCIKAHSEEIHSKSTQGTSQNRRELQLSFTQLTE